MYLKCFNINSTCYKIVFQHNPNQHRKRKCEMIYPWHKILLTYHGQQKIVQTNFTIYSCLHCGTLQWHHNVCDNVSNHQPHHCLLNRLFRRRSKKTSKLRVTGLCAGTSPMTDKFPAQMTSNAEMFPFHDVIMNMIRLNSFPWINGWYCHPSGIGKLLIIHATYGRNPY